MYDDTFVTSYQREFVWPSDLPVKLSPWPPPKKPCERDLTCPPPPAPDCPCPKHTWAQHAGHYACQAEREKLIHRAVQRVRREIKKGENRRQEEADKTQTDIPPLSRDEPKKSCYQIDFARKDVVEVSFTDMLAEIEATPIAPGPLGRTLYGGYTDPTPLRDSYLTRPHYDPSRPIARSPFPDILDQYFNDYPGSTEYMDKYSSSAVKNVKNSQRWKYPAPFIEYQLPVPSVPAITAE